MYCDNSNDWLWFIVLKVTLLTYELPWKQIDFIRAIEWYWHMRPSAETDTHHLGQILLIDIVIIGVLFCILLRKISTHAKVLTGQRLFHYHRFNRTTKLQSCYDLCIVIPMNTRTAASSTLWWLCNKCESALLLCWCWSIKLQLVHEASSPVLCHTLHPLRKYTIPQPKPPQQNIWPQRCLLCVRTRREKKF